MLLTVAVAEAEIGQRHLDAALTIEQESEAVVDQASRDCSSLEREHPSIVLLDEVRGHTRSLGRVMSVACASVREDTPTTRSLQS